MHFRKSNPTLQPRFKLSLRTKNKQKALIIGRMLSVKADKLTLNFFNGEKKTFTIETTDIKDVLDKLTAQINKEPSKPHLHHHCLFPRREGKQTESDMLMDSSLAHGPIYDRLRINLSVSGFEIPLLTP